MAGGNNIEALREARGWKRPELARRMKTTPQQVERLEKGQRRLTQDWIVRAADALEVAPATIIGGTYDPQLEADLLKQAALRGLEGSPRTDDDVVEIASLDLSLSMGPGTLIEEFIESEPVKISMAFVQAITRTHSDRLRFVRGIGESMEPTLRSSDRIMIDINDRQFARINGIYWIDYQGAHGIKRLRPAGPGKLMVGSDNPNVPDFEVRSDEIRIEGRAIWFGREL